MAGRLADWRSFGLAEQVGVVSCQLSCLFKKIIASGVLVNLSTRLGPGTRLCLPTVFFFLRLVVRSLLLVVRRGCRTLSSRCGGVWTRRCGVQPRDLFGGWRHFALGETFSVTPMIDPSRGHLDSFRRLVRGDLYFGRGSRQRASQNSRYCNNFKFAVHGRTRALDQFKVRLNGDSPQCTPLWALTGRRLVCHCQEKQPCHADVQRWYPTAYDGETVSQAPPPSGTTPEAT